MSYLQVARRVILALVAIAVTGWLVVWLASPPTYTSYVLAAVPPFPSPGHPPPDLAKRMQQWRSIGLSDAFLFHLVRQYRLYPDASEHTAVTRLRRAIFIRKVDFPSDNRTGVIDLEVGLNYPATSSDKTTMQHVANDVFWSIFQVDSAYMNRLHPLPSGCRHVDCENGEILLIDSAGPGKRRSW